MSDDAGRTPPKPEHLDRLSSLWRRMNEHKLVQWSVAYAAVAYGIQHAIILTSESFEWPNAVARISMLLFALGLPLVVTFAWYHGERASRRISGPELTIIAILLAASTLLFYVLVRPAERQPGVEAARSAAALPSGAISLAVLPFVNLSSDKEQEFFSDGMTEEITSALAKISGLYVVARTSAFQFKGENKDVRTIGQALGASHLIEGSVRKDGNEVRITVQLIRADDGRHVWTENYNRELKGVFAVQEEIAQAIAASLQVPLGLKQGESLVSKFTGDTDSYQDYLRARALVRVRGLKPLTDAATLLEQVVSRDPNYAPAWALLSLAYGVTPNFHPAWFGGSVADKRRVVDANLPKAEAAAQRAIQLDPRNADGYVTLAIVQAQRGKMLAAGELFSKGLELDSNNPEIFHQYSQWLAEVGRVKEGAAMRQRLQTLEPLTPVFNASTARVLWIDGQNDAAIGLLRDVPANLVWGKISLATIYASGGRYGEAAGTLAEIPTGSFPSGMVDDAIRLLRAAPTPAASPQSLPHLGALGFVYLYVGTPDRVLEYYEDQIEAGSLLSFFAAEAWHPSYASVRKTERFKAVIRKAGFVEYWRVKGWPAQCHPVGADDFACE